MFPGTKLVAALAAIAMLTACSGPLPFFGRPTLPREVVEADLRAKLADSQVSTFTLELQSIGWVDANMPARYGEPVSFGEPDRDPSQVVWVAFLEGRLSTAIWPTPLQGQPSPGKVRPPGVPDTPPSPVEAFTKALMLIDPENGMVFAMMAKPEPRQDVAR